MVCNCPGVHSEERCALDLTFSLQMGCNFADDLLQVVLTLGLALMLQMVGSTQGGHTKQI